MPRRLRPCPRLDEARADAVAALAGVGPRWRAMRVRGALRAHLALDPTGATAVRMLRSVARHGRLRAWRTTD